MTQRMKDTLLGLYDFKVGRLPKRKRQRLVLIAAIRISYDTMTDGDETNRDEVIKQLAKEAKILPETVEEVLDKSSMYYVSIREYRRIHQHIANNAL